jgi:hypothetical protein
MGVKHLPDGEDFGSEHFPKDFGFSGSAGGAKATRHAAKPAAAHNPVSTTSTARAARRMPRASSPRAVPRTRTATR